jgi:uncharacterized membrane protein
MVATFLNRRRWAILGSLALLSGFTVTACAVRYLYTGSSQSSNLVWNLFLAWIPLVVALLVYDAARRGVRPAVLLAGGAAWLLFFPNAPYLLTDFKHLGSWSGVPVWFDVVLLSAAAWTGLLLGFASLYLVQSVARDLLSATAAWAIVLASLVLGSVGMYLGRFERWNSWDIVSSPRLLFGDLWAGLTSPADHPRALAVTVLFAAFLTLAYLTFYNLLALGRGERESA